MKSIEDIRTSYENYVGDRDHGIGVMSKPAQAIIRAQYEDWEKSVAPARQLTHIAEEGARTHFRMCLMGAGMAISVADRICGTGYTSGFSVQASGRR